MNSLKTYGLLLLASLSLGECSYNPQLTLEAKMRHYSGTFISTYFVQDPDNRLKREIFRFYGIPRDSLNALIEQHNGKDIKARVEGNRYSTVVFLSSNEIELRLHDTDNNGEIDLPQKKPEYSTKASEEILEQNRN